MFTTVNSASYRFNFQSSDQTIFLRHSSRLYHETGYQTNTPDNQIATQIRPPHLNTTTNHCHDLTTKSDYQILPPPLIQTTSSDHPTRPQDSILDCSACNQAQHTQPLEMVQVRCILYGLGQGGYIELWMNLAKHTFHTRSAWSFRTFFRFT